MDQFLRKIKDNPLRKNYPLTINLKSCPKIFKRGKCTLGNCSSAKGVFDLKFSLFICTMINQIFLVFYLKVECHFSLHFFSRRLVEKTQMARAVAGAPGGTKITLNWSKRDFVRVSEGKKSSFWSFHFYAYVKSFLNHTSCLHGVDSKLFY